MKDTPPNEKQPAPPQPAQEWAVKAAKEWFSAYAPEHPIHQELARCILKHAPVPVGDAAVKVLVERLRPILETLQMLRDLSDRDTTRLADEEQAITDAITALESLARERAELACEQGRVHSVLFTVEEVAYYDDKGVRGIDEQVADLAGLYRQLQKNCLQAFDLKVEVEAERDALRAEVELLKGNLAHQKSLKTDSEMWKVNADLRSDLTALREKLATAERELDRLRIYEAEHLDTIKACMWMHDDKTLDIPLGKRLTVEGIAALRNQRDAARADAEALAGALGELRLRVDADVLNACSDNEVDLSYRELNRASRKAHALVAQHAARVRPAGTEEARGKDL